MAAKSKFNFLLLNSDRDNQAYSQILDELPTGSNFLAEETETFETALRRVVDRGISCFVFSATVFDMNVVGILQRILLADTSLIIIAVVNKLNLEAFNVAKRLTRIGIVEKPLQKGELGSLCEKILLGRKLYLRQFKRFRTKQEVEIESVSKGEKFKGTIFNISKGGAFLELDKGELKIGDVLKADINLSELSKTHNVILKVMWIIRQSPERNRPGYGLQFISVDDVTKSLLEKLES